MLQQMRQGSQSIFIYLAFGILIVVFTFYFGPGTDGCEPSQRQAAATVNGQTVYNTDIKILLNRVNRNRRNTNDAEFTTLQSQTLEKLTLMILLADKAAEQGFEVAPKELADYILDGDRNIDFQIYSKDGVFDMEIYERYISNYLEVTVEEYEAFKSRELLVVKYLSALENTVAVLPAEVDELNKLRNTKVDLEFVKFEASKLEEVLSFTDEEVQAHADQSAEAVKKYFDDNQKEFGKPKRVRVRRLTVNIPGEAASEGDKKAAEDKWALVKDRVMVKNEDFETVVKELSDDIAYKDKGGDMGWSLLEDMNQDMAKVVDAMKKGEVKDYSSNFAHFLLKIDDVEEAEVKTFEQVKLDIARKLLLGSAGDKRVKALADELLAKAKADPTKSLEEVLASLKPAPEPPKEEPVPTPPADGAVPPVDGAVPPVDGAVPPVDGAPADGAPADGAPADGAVPPADGEAPPVDGEQEKVEEKIEVKKSPWELVSVANTGAFARAPRQSFKFDQVLKQIVPTQLPWTDVPRLGDNKDLAIKAFELKADAPLLTEVLKINDAYVVVRLKERTDPTKEELDKSREGVESELRQQRVNAFLGPWQTLFYRPDAEVKATSPWIHSVYEEAKKAGKVEIIPGIFVAPAPEEPVVDPAAATGAPPGANGATGTPPVTTPPAN